jgi:2-polyprenyl-3-methyl-5-hydroxy-6-metoxy-1,4-benzoquinol methylase
MSIVRWAKSKGFEVRILAVDECPSVINLARDHYGSVSEITFDVRFLTDPRFLEAQQFDYVISSSMLHTLEGPAAVRALKTANLLARRGIVFSDWMRDIRAWLWMQALARFWGDDFVIHDGLLAIRKGFTVTELRHLTHEAQLEYLEIRRHLGYRFSVAGERALVLSRKAASVPGLASA